MTHKGWRVVKPQLNQSILKHHTNFVADYRGSILWFHIGRPCVSMSIRQLYVHQSVRISFPDDNE